MIILNRNKWAVHSARTGKLLAAVLIAGGISASAVLVSTAGASNGRKTKSVVVSATKNAKLGTVLTSGKTLYTLNKTDCTAQCLKIWPALTLPKGVTKATAGSGVTASKLGTQKLASGALQVTYSGKALYFFAGDTGAGQVRGNGLKDTWGTWSVFVTVKPTSGTKPSAPAGTPAPSTTTPPTSGTTAPTTTSPSPTTTSPSKPTTTTTSPSTGGISF